MRKLTIMAAFGAVLLVTESCTAGDREDPNLTSEESGISVTAAAAPKYSAVAVAIGVTGDVEVVVAVDPNGVVTSADAATGHVLLRLDAVDAAQGWRFRQQPEGGKIKLIFSFRILSRDAAEQEAGVTFFPPNRVEVRSKPAPPPPVQN